jgi:hypothetical protein
MRDYDLMGFALVLRDYSDYFSHSTSGTYLEVPVSDKVIRELKYLDHFDYNVDEYYSDGDRSLYVSLQTGEGPNCIRIDWEEAETRHELNLKDYGQDRYPAHAISVPAQFVEHDDRSPLYGASVGFEIRVEFDFEEICLRIYDNSDYRERLKQIHDSDKELPSTTAPKDAI